MANDIMVELRKALEPRNPYYALRFSTTSDDVDVMVYDAESHNPTFDCTVTESVARTMLEGAACLSLDDDAVEFEQITAHLDRAPEPTPLTCSVGDLLDIVLTALDREGQAHVSIDGANWLVTR